MLEKINKIVVEGKTYDFSEKKVIGEMTGLVGIDMEKDLIYSTISSPTGFSIADKTYEPGTTTIIVCEPTINTIIRVVDPKIKVSGKNTLIVKKDVIFIIELSCISEGEYVLSKRGIEGVDFYGEFGDFVLLDTESEKYISTNIIQFNPTFFPSTKFKPVGVVIVPGELNNIYSDKSAGIISLVDESCEGQEDIIWGIKGKRLGTLSRVEGLKNTKEGIYFRGSKGADWKPSPTNPSDYPGFSICDLKGKYLPGIDEFSKIFQDIGALDLINNVLVKVKEFFPESQSAPLNGNYMSSTEIDQNFIYSAKLTETAVNESRYLKSDVLKVRSFFRVGRDGKKIKGETLNSIQFTLHLKRGEPDPSKIVTIEGDNPELLLKDFRRCMAKANGGKARICFLRDDNSNYYEDGEIADLEGPEGDVMVYFPDLWYKGETTETEHIFRISNKSIPGYHHAPASLVGAYKAVENNISENISYLRSISGFSFWRETSFNYYKKFVNLTGKGFHLVSYLQRCILDWMLLARYQSTDIASFCGKIEDDNKLLLIPTGTTNHLGNTDSTQLNLINNTTLPNFLGIEGCYGGGFEILDYTSVDSNNKTITIEGRESKVEYKQFPNVGYVKDIIGGEYMDTLPLDTIKDGSGKYWIGNSGASGNTYEEPTVIASSNSTGFFSYFFSHRPDIALGNYTTRLAFDGPIEVVKSSKEFNNPSAVPVQFTLRLKRGEPDPSKIVTVEGGDPELLLRRFRRCMAKKTETGVDICYLADSDSRYYHDGGEANLGGDDGDVMVYFPDIWYKGETTDAEHIFNISSTEVEGYHHAPASLVGAYKGCENFNSSITINSHLGKTIKRNITYSDAVTRTRANGEGFHQITYLQHCIIGWMFLARYQNTNSQAICGKGGVDLGSKPTGTSINIYDTTPIVDQLGVYNNFLGIESCWGCYNEWVEGIHVRKGGKTVVTDTGDYIDTDYESLPPTKREFDPVNLSVYFTDIRGGEYMDMLPYGPGGSESTYYCDYTSSVNELETGNAAFDRSHDKEPKGGVFYLDGCVDSKSFAGNQATRLAYDGPINIVEDSGLFTEYYAGDPVLMNKETKGVSIIRQRVWKKKKELYPANKYYPIGVVVIPGSHDVYENSSVGVMSLMNMSSETPDSGSNVLVGIKWGNKDEDIEALKNFTSFNQVGPYNSPGSSVIGSPTSGDSWGILPTNDPSVYKEGAICPTDGSTYYPDEFETGQTRYACPSPYKGNLRNSEYYKTSSPGSSTNCFSDFGGKENTRIITELATAQPGWKTDPTLTDSVDGAYYPAACACWRYNPGGLMKQGDWYLPAQGELCYIAPRLLNLNSAIKELKSWFGEEIIGNELQSDSSLGQLTYYWSSTEREGVSDGILGDNCARGLNLRCMDCTVEGRKKNLSYNARAFTTIKYKETSHTITFKVNFPADLIIDYSIGDETYSESLGTGRTLKDIKYGSTIYWKASKIGYISKTGSLLVERDSTIEVGTLEKVKYDITFTYTPTDATVKYIIGESEEVSPKIEVPKSGHKIQVEHGDSLGWSAEKIGYKKQTGYIKSVTSSQTINITLEEAFWDITFKTNNGSQVDVYYSYLPDNKCTTKSPIKNKIEKVPQGNKLIWCITSGERIIRRGYSGTVEKDMTVEVDVTTPSKVIIKYNPLKKPILYEKTSTGEKGNQVVLDDSGVLERDFRYGWYNDTAMSDYGNITEIDTKYYDSREVVNFQDMFRGTGAATFGIYGLGGPINLVTSNVTSMLDSFSHNESLVLLDLLGLDTSKVTDMTTMFFNCNKLMTVNLNFDTSNVERMTGMFLGTNLYSIDCSKWRTDKLVSVSFMFANCQRLEKLYLDNFDCSKVVSDEGKNGMFFSSPKINYIKCKQAFKDWCLANAEKIFLPDTMKSGGSGTWEIVE